MKTEQFNRPVLHKRYFCNSQPGHKEDGEVGFLWSGFANRRLVFPIAGGVGDKYGIT